ncbi:hypothetical protein MLD38_022607 [Melastoma candidum]|uniref:Uncharacterized protein n=1 Tax=Melastoma candidum TaxID=119954 RepID=A0ACB9QJQ7_9MYRT|nr:hypothetical protein MLD38_022607 [Melastoma candidum]
MSNGLSPAAKPEGVRFDSPATAALLEALFSDEAADRDFMIFSPVTRNPQLLLPNSGNECGDARATKGKIVPPTWFSPLVSSSSAPQRFEGGQSPLYKVFHSPGYRELLAEYNLRYDKDGTSDGYGLGLYSSANCLNASATGTATLEMPIDSRFHSLIGSSNQSRPSHVGDICQQPFHMPVASMTAPTAALSEQFRQEQHYHHELDKPMMPVPISTDLECDRGLQLVHLLLACAEAVSKEDYMLGRNYLHELNQVATPLGDPMQRVASCFAEALLERLAGSFASNPSRALPPFPPHSLEMLNIYQTFYQACPYIKFAHFTTNQAIFDAFHNEKRVHVIDLDILRGYQWPSFMQALATRPGGAPFLRITGVGSCLESVCETGRCLAELAHSLYIPFEFHPVGERLETLKSYMLNRRVGEALAVTSVNRLHRVPAICLGSLLTMIREQAPVITTLVEQEASHNETYFFGRFLEALHYYSAIFDSLDATFPQNSMQRTKVEQYIFGPEIKNIVACEGPERTERHERHDKWRKLMEGRGFRGVPLGDNAVAMSEILLNSFPKGGYRLIQDNGCLLLAWQDTAIVAASAWQC